MKNIVAAGFMVMAIGGTALTGFAGSWQQDGGGWWYRNDDGSYPLNSWMEIDNAWYYFDGNGYMLSDTATPDGYNVGADGKWIANVTESSTNVPEYLSYMLDPNNVFQDGKYGKVNAKYEKIQDRGGYYEIPNQTVSVATLFDTKEAAEACPEYQKEYPEARGTKQLSNGRWVAYLEDMVWVSHPVWKGSLYINRDARVKYSPSGNLQDFTYISFENLMSMRNRPSYMKYGLNAVIQELDANGYISEIQIVQWG